MDSHGGTKDRHVPRASPRVYRRRRIVVLVLALLLTGALVWAGIAIAGLIGQQDPEATGSSPSAPTSTGPEESPEPSESASDAPAPSESPEAPPSSAPTCDESQVVVSASTDAEAYAADQNPVLTLTVTNNGEVTCPVNVGTSQMEFLVTSGEDRIFSSLDCQEGADDLSRDIPPGGSEQANFTWERTRSVPGCEAVAAEPAPGFYVLTAELGERTSEEAAFELR